jgi:tRNA-2-methylthio-N6-dimethylallyladenosine synthase
MNRRYTRGQYLDRIGRLRECCPDVAVTSDFIVGFPGETESDFQETLDLMETVEFDSVFSFKYSDRPSAPASRFPDKVTEAVKSDRLARLLEIQKAGTLKRLQSRVGTEPEILVEGRSPRSSESDSIPVKWTGRTSSNHIVHFSPPDWDNDRGADLTGTMKRVRITHSFSHSLWGELLSD